MRCHSGRQPTASGTCAPVVSSSCAWLDGVEVCTSGQSERHRRAQAEKSSHTMRVANADSDWDIHCFYLPRDPAAAWCGVGERHNFEKQVYGPRRTGAPADEPDVELGFHDALRVARLVAKGDQMTLEILLSRPVYTCRVDGVGGERRVTTQRRMRWRETPRDYQVGG